MIKCSCFYDAFVGAAILFLSIITIHLSHFDKGGTGNESRK